MHTHQCVTYDSVTTEKPFTCDELPQVICWDYFSIWDH